MSRYTWTTFDDLADDTGDGLVDEYLTVRPTAYKPRWLEDVLPENSSRAALAKEFRNSPHPELHPWRKPRKPKPKAE